MGGWVGRRMHAGIGGCATGLLDMKMSLLRRRARNMIIKSV
jgi:hypothetical protein